MTSILVTLKTDATNAIDWVETELTTEAKVLFSDLLADANTALKALEETTLGTDIMNLISAASSGGTLSVAALLADAEKLYADFAAGGGLSGIWDSVVSLAKALLTSLIAQFKATL